MFKGQYLIIVIRLKSRNSNINVHYLPFNKLFVYHEDNKTLAFVFYSLVEACRALMPKRCKNLSYTYLTKQKNIQFILRVINKGVVTNTEAPAGGWWPGKFYLFKNPGYSSSLALVVWGLNLCSTVGSVFSKEERDMIKLPSFQ